MNFKLKLQRFALILGVLIILAWLIPRLWNMFMERPYFEFIQNIKKVQPRLMLLNESVLEQIPPPNGVFEKERSQTTGVGSPVHAITLDITYQLANDLPKDSVFLHYDNLLLPNDWNKIEYGINTRLYYLQDSCVEIDFSTLNTYRVQIWQDFLTQNFTPNPPPRWVMFYHELMYTDYMPCPPQ